MATLFLCLLFLCALQRLVELVHSHRNRAWLRQQGFEQVEGDASLRNMVLLHVAWFLSMGVEFVAAPANPPKFVTMPALFLFLTAEMVRIAVFRALGKQWNISVMSPAPASGMTLNFVQTGPYRYIRHPNYFAVILEVLALPLIGGCYRTAIVFSVLNGLVLFRRIKVEEEALFKRPGYREIMGRKGMLFPFKIRASKRA